MSELIPPFRFGMISSKLYRGGYPVLRNFPHMKSLGLKTIISLIPESPTADLAMMCKLLNINLVHIPLNRNANMNSVVNPLLKALTIILNKESYPIYIHCLDGRRITSLFVLLIRRLSLVSSNFSIAEYWKYQLSGNMKAVLMQDIEKQTLDIEKIFYYNTVDNTAVVFEVILPDTALLPSWFYSEDKLSHIPGWKFIVSKPSVPASSSTTGGLQLVLSTAGNTPTAAAMGTGHSVYPLSTLVTNSPNVLLSSAPMTGCNSVTSTVSNHIYHHATHHPPASNSTLLSTITDGVE